MKPRWMCLVLLGVSISACQNHSAPVPQVTPAEAHLIESALHLKCPCSLDTMAICFDGGTRVGDICDSRGVHLGFCKDGRMVSVDSLRASGRIRRVGGKETTSADVWKYYIGASYPTYPGARVLEQGSGSLQEAEGEVYVFLFL